MKNRTFLFPAMKALGIMGLALFLGSCASTYYKTMEAFGVHKRDILVDRIEEARDSQEDAGEQFRTALERYRDVVEFEGGELEQKYNQLQAEYDRSYDRAQMVTQKITSVEKVAEDLFDEWKSELNEYSDASLRRSSEKTLRQTQRRYDELIDAMRRAESRMPPVLSRLKDQVLFLKHNLNARAIASLEGTSLELQSEVEDLLKELEKSIAEANEFIDQLM